MDHDKTFLISRNWHTNISWRVTLEFWLITVNRYNKRNVQSGLQFPDKKLIPFDYFF